MSYRKRPLKQAVAEHEATRQTWTYWVSRDSLNGDLSGTCSLWYAKPVRAKHKGRVVWIGASDTNPCFIGQYPVDEIAGWFNVYPETDMELIKAEQYPSAKRLAEAAGA